MSSLLEILEIVLPVFLVIALGWGLRWRGFLDQAFLVTANRLVYNVALPLLLFTRISQTDFRQAFNLRLVLGSWLALLLLAALAWLLATMSGAGAPRRGAFAQGSFRGNLAYIGLAIAFYGFGNEGLARAGILMGFLVPILNLFAILVLRWPHRGESKDETKVSWWREIVLNPLIVASALGIVWSSLSVPMPPLLSRGLDIASAMTLPLALLTIGGSFSWIQLRGTLAPALAASLLKIVALPALTLFVLRLAGVEGLDLAIGIVLAATPAATVNPIMASELGGDSSLAGSVVMCSTLLSALTYSLWMLLLRTA